MRCQFFEDLLLLLGQPGRYMHLDRDQEIAGLARLRADALSLDPEGLARWGPGGDLQVDRAVQGRHLDLGAEGSLGEADRDGKGEVVALPTEPLTPSYPDSHQEVSRRPTVGAGPTFATQSENGAIADTCGDPELDLPGPVLTPRTTTGGAGGLDDATRPAALRAGLGEREKALVLGHHPPTPTGRTGAHCGSRLCAGAPAT